MGKWKNSNKDDHEKRKKKKENLWPLWLIGGGLFVFMIFFSMRHTYVDMKNQTVQQESTYHENFPGLENANDLDKERRSWIIQTANAEPCACQCGHKLAHCLVSDETCPVREKNRARVAEIIRQARATPKGGTHS